MQLSVPGNGSSRSSHSPRSQALVKIAASVSQALVPSRQMLVRLEGGEEREARAVLHDLGRGKTPLPPDRLADHVLRMTDGAEWPVMRAGLEAIIRRWDFAKRDGLRIAERPGRKALFGTYTTSRVAKGSRGRSGLRPYQSRLDSLDPIGGSCNCPDYQRNSLGICKHLLVVLVELEKTRSRANGPSAAFSRPAIVWDPVRPLIGGGDWLERVHLSESFERERQPIVIRRTAERYFSRNGRLVDSFADHPTKRLELLAALAKATDDPALLGLIQKDQPRLERAIAGNELVRAAPRILRGLKRPLYPYQLEGVCRFLSIGRLLLADDMGLGKTAQAIASCHVLYESGKVKRGLLLVPAALKPQWLREWREFSDVPIELVDGSGKERAALYRSTKRGFLIVNYEQLLRDFVELQRWAPEVVVLDEAQRIKNWATKTATYVKELQSTYRLVLTGTPMENRLEELASIFDWVDDLALEPKWRLGPFHSAFVDGRKEVAGAQHLDVLRLRLAGSMIRRRRPEVLAQLPSRTDTRISVPLTDEQAEAHAAYDQPIAQLVARAKKRPLQQAEFMRLMSYLTMQRMICNGCVLQNFQTVWPRLSATRPEPSELQALFSPKLLELRELLANLVITQERKVVVFSQWRRMLRLAEWATSDLLTSAGVRALYFTGEEGSKRRTQNLVDFHDDPQARVLFASDAGGVGLNLQKAANACINLELPWNPAVLEQRVGRIYRLGQKDPVDVFHLVCESGIESRIAGLVGDKRALFSGLFDSGSDEVHFDRSGSFLDRVERLIEPVVIPEVSEVAESDAEDLVAAEAPADLLPVEEPATPEAESSSIVLPTLSLSSMTELLATLDIRPTEGGGVAISVPRETAHQLGSLLSELARKLAVTPSA